MKIFNQIIVVLLLCFTSVTVWGIVEEDSNEIASTLDILTNDRSILHTNAKKQNLLHLAVQAEDMAAVQWLTNKAPSLLNGRDEDGDTPFLLSCLVANMEIADFLLSYTEFVDINEFNNSKTTCLHYLSLGLHLDAISMMVEKGADPSLQDSDGDLPGHVLLLRLLFGKTELNLDDLRSEFESLNMAIDSLDEEM